MPLARVLSKRGRRFVFFSNAFFFIPFWIAVQNGIWLMAGMLTINIVLSSLYHHSHERRFHSADIVFALMLIGLNIFLVALGKFSFFYTAALVAIVVVTLGLWALARLYPKHYALCHGMWHIGSVIITTLSLAIYLLE